MHLRRSSRYLGLVGFALIACGGESLPEEQIGTTARAFNPSDVPTDFKGHVMITQKAIEVLKKRNLLPPMLDDRVDAPRAKHNLALLVYGNDFADHAYAGWPDPANDNRTEPVAMPNHMTSKLGGWRGSLALTSTNTWFNFQFTKGVWSALATVDASVDLTWKSEPSTALEYTVRLHVDVDDGLIEVPVLKHYCDQLFPDVLCNTSESPEPRDYTADNLYHYAYGDLRDFKDPSIGEGDMQLRFYPFLPEHLPDKPIEFSQPLTSFLRNQALLTGADFGVTKYGAILYQLARRFFPGSGHPAPKLSDLIKAGNDVPSWHTGFVRGHGGLDSLRMPMPHTYLGGMPFVCHHDQSTADPCATGTPTWPTWIIGNDASTTESKLSQLRNATPPRSERAALIYLGWATHMIQDASLPHHVAGWVGLEHEVQDALGDQPWYFRDFSQYAGATITTRICPSSCKLGACLPCYDHVTPHPYAKYAPYSQWLIDSHMAGEVNGIFGPEGAAKSRTQICQSLGLTDESFANEGLNWEAAQPVFLANAKQAYYARQETLRGDDAIRAGREYVKNAVIGTAKLILCAVPNGPAIAGAPSGPPRAKVFQHFWSGGRVQELEPGIYDAVWSGPNSLRSLGDGEASSLTLPSGFGVRLFDQSVAKGVNQSFAAGTTDLSSFNDLTSSIQVVRNGESGTFFIRLKRDWEEPQEWVRQHGSSRYLTINRADPATDSGRPAMSSAYSGSLGQQWRYDVNTRAIVDADGLCLDVYYGSPDNGTPVKMWYCNGTPAQQWEFTAEGQIKNANGKCLSALQHSGGWRAQADMRSGAETVMWECNVPTAQAWEVTYACPHDPCTTGGALPASCSMDVAEVCAADNYCCTGLWDSTCVNQMPRKCQWYGDRPHGFSVQRPTECGVFRTDNGLIANQTWRSCDGRFQLMLGADGNATLRQIIHYDPPPPPPAPSGTSVLLWQTATSGTPGMLIMQSDGNLVLYDPKGGPMWSSGTAGNPGATVRIQNDGNLVIYGATGHPIWATNTCCR